MLRGQFVWMHPFELENMVKSNRLTYIQVASKCKTLGCWSLADAVCSRHVPVLRAQGREPKPAVSSDPMGRMRLVKT
jgi:hypothetical protein